MENRIKRGEKSIKIRIIDKVPRIIIDSFCRAAGANENQLNAVLESDVNAGAFDKEKLIGFASGKTLGNGELFWTGLYVEPECRIKNWNKAKVGVGQRLATKFFMEAKRKGCTAVKGYDLIFASYRLMKKIQETVNLKLPEKRPFRISAGAEKIGYWAHVTFLPIKHKMDGKTEEILDLVNEKDEVIGTAPRSEVCRKGLLHRCAGVYAVHNGKIVIQIRARTKGVRPLNYSIVEETVKSGETFQEACRRGVKEELGLEVEELEFVGKRIIRDREYKDNFVNEVFIAKCKGEIKIDKAELEAANAMSVQEIELLLKKEKKVSPGLKETFRIARPMLEKMVKK